MTDKKRSTWTTPAEALARALAIEKPRESLTPSEKEPKT